MLPPHPIKPWIVFTAPFESGTPNPEIAQDPTGHGTSLEEWANPVNGNISLAIVGGTVGTGFPDPNDPNSSVHSFPMPDRWFGGDAIQASGTIKQTVDLKKRNLPAQVKSLSVTAIFLSSSNSAPGKVNYENNMWLVAGKASAPLTGLVGIYGGLNLGLQTGSVDGSGNFIANAETSHQVPFMTKQIINSGATVGEYPTTVIYDSWFMKPNKFGTSTLLITSKIAINPNEYVLQIQAGAVLIGFRGGITPMNDQSAGYLSASFQDIPSATKVFEVDQQNSPLQLFKLEIFLS